MSTVTTLKAGDTAADRRLIAAAAAVTPDPTLATDGWSMQGGNYLHLYTELTAPATAAAITPWYYSEIAGQWFEGNQLTFTAADAFALIQVEGEARAFIVVDSLTGAGTVDVWGGWSWSYPGGDAF
jgi:hypothetical protein